MTISSRELVLRTLNFQSPPRVPRQLWALPIATSAFPQEFAPIKRDYPPDITHVGGHERIIASTSGKPTLPGRYTDAWGCTFINLQAGVIGEVKEPAVNDWATDRRRIHVPREWLTIDRDAINRDCAATELFTLAGTFPRPFEQLQFIRGTENLYLDLCDPPPAMPEFLREMHGFYCELMTRWAATDVDSLWIMDDWGSQRALLIAPDMWREYFKPMYRDYVHIARGAGKKVFMHSDGHIAAIYPDLIEIGIDALNSQIFCMGLENLEKFAGRITFWGEIDRQHLLPEGTPADIDRAVRQVHQHLWRNGGCIAQCEFGPAAKPENVRQVFATWDSLFNPAIAGPAPSVAGP